MTGPEHYLEALRMLKASERMGPASMELIATAQVHATLALVAATAIPADRRGWVEAVR